MKHQSKLNSMKFLILMALCMLMYNKSVSQNVGIGTNNPTEKLQVIGTVKSTAMETPSLSLTSSDDYNKIKLWGTHQYTIGMVSNMTNGYLNDWATTFTMSNNANRGWIFRRDTDAKSDGAMSLTTDGRMFLKGKALFNDKVGIGVDPQYPLDISTAASGWQGHFKNVWSEVYLAHQSGYGMLISTGGNNNAGRYAMKIRNADQIHMTVGDAGSVGIGTETPTEKLQVVGNIKSTGMEADNIKIMGLAGGRNQMLTVDNNGDVNVGVIPAADNLGNHTATTALNLNGNLLTNAPQLSLTSTDDYSKIKLYGTDQYTIGMVGNMTHGYLNDWATTFTMNNASDRGWVFRRDTDAKSDGAMSLTTDGRMFLKGRARLNDKVGIGMDPVYPLDVLTPASGTWQGHFKNQNSEVYLAHQSGYGMHINTGGNNSASRYVLELRNADQYHMRVADNGQLNLWGDFHVKGPANLGIGGQNYVAIFENNDPTDPSNNRTGTDGIAIKIGSNGSAREEYLPNSGNDYITFLNGKEERTGSIEGFDIEEDNPIWDFPGLDFDDFFNVLDFDNVFTAPSFDANNFITFTPPSLDIDFSDVFDPVVNFDAGGLSIDWNAFDPGGFDFDSFFNPTAAGSAAQSLQDLSCWSMKHDLQSMMTTNPFDLAMSGLIIARTNLCKDNNGKGGVTYTSYGADYAEWLPRFNTEEEIFQGQIVGVKNGRISKITKGADQILAISTNPIVLGNEPIEGQEANYEKVGFMGQVPVLVKGKVREGDYIIPTGQNDGFGIAVPTDELELKHIPLILGRAWSNSENDFLSYINVAIGLNRNDLAKITLQQQEEIITLKEKVQLLEASANQINDLADRLAKLELQSSITSNK